MFARFKNRSKSRTDENKESKDSKTSPSQKRKLDTSSAAPTSRHHHHHEQESSKALKVDASGSPTSTRRYVLLSDEEKDSILYEKPECVDRILGELIKFAKDEKNVDAFQAVPLTTDMGFLNHQLCPMISR